MTQEHVELLSLRPAPRRRAGVRPARGAERHIVVATQDLPRMSAAIQELMAAGYTAGIEAAPEIRALIDFSKNPHALTV